MDIVKARGIVDQLQGQSVGGWEVKSLIDCGKSALVIRAVRNNEVAALKLFDKDVVARFGRDAQLMRIDRERSLIGSEHPNLVRILDGGECERTGFLFVVMELIKAPNLAQVVETIPRERVRSIIQNVASAAKYLESRLLVHRDIKPSNIAITDDYRGILLDLGVLRPIDGSRMSTGSGDEFVGTLQYSSPEFLMRHEEDSRDGWRAVTFYQLGATLHDLIMRYPIFHESESPYARLVNAVMFEDPVIEATDVPADLILLARHCLTKKPDSRLKLVSWDSFFASEENRARSTEARDRIAARLARAGVVEGPILGRRVDTRRVLSSLCDEVELMARYTVLSSSLFPPITIQTSYLEDDEAVIGIVFNSSQRFSLRAPLLVSFGLRLLDSGTRAIELSVSAALSVSEPSPDLQFKQVFIGVPDASVVTGLVESAITLAFDKAQQSAPAGTKQRSPIVLDIEWDADHG